MATINDVNSLYFQPSLTNYGEIVQGIDDIHQCIYIILTTEKGEDPTRPDFGCSALSRLDLPINTAIPMIKADILDSLELYETRIKVVKVEHSLDALQLGKVKIRITWTLGDNVQVTDFNLN
jgi:phage baseplate assembly protein W